MIYYTLEDPGFKTGNMKLRRVAPGASQARRTNRNRSRTPQYDQHFPGFNRRNQSPTLWGALLDKEPVREDPSWRVTKATEGEAIGNLIRNAINSRLNLGFKTWN